MKIIYGTSNLSKLTFMRDRLKGLDIEVLGLDSVKMNLVEPSESGNNPSENAYIKAITYYQQIQMPVMSADSGLYFEGVNVEDQPGIFIKRHQGREMTSKEMVDHYSQLAKKYGGKIKAQYVNALCIVSGDRQVFMLDGDKLMSEPFYIVAQAHEKYEEGFPLNCLSVDIETMTYYYDLKEVPDKYIRTHFDANMRAFVSDFIHSFT